MHKIKVKKKGGHARIGLFADMAIKIFIDQGHNPVNPNAGAEGQGLREQDITYDIGVRLAALLNADPDFSARLSRENDSVVLGTSNASSLRLRVEAANAWDADLFISLHTNAATSAAANGSEALVFRRDSEAFRIAEVVLASLTRTAGTRKGSRPPLAVGVEKSSNARTI